VTLWLLNEPRVLGGACTCTSRRGGRAESLWLFRPYGLISAGVGILWDGEFEETTPLGLQEGNTTEGPRT
jgi:hypothetical protein